MKAQLYLKVNEEINRRLESGKITTEQADILDSLAFNKYIVEATTNNSGIEKWKLIPKKSIGKIRFGMTSDNIRRMFGKPKMEFAKAKDNKKKSDNYGNFHVVYDDENKVIAVEILGGVEVIFGSYTLYPNTLIEIKKSLVKFTESNNKLINEENSISITVSGNSLTSISVATDGYFNSTPEEKTEKPAEPVKE